MKSSAEGTERHCKKSAVAVVLLFLIVAVGVGYVFARQTPRYSLYWFKKAILKHDADSALKYLDIDSILDNMVKDSASDRNGEGVRERSGGPIRGIGRDIIVQNLPAIKQQLREQLKSAIVSLNDRRTLDNLEKASVFGLQITMEGDLALVKIWGKDKVAFKMARSPEGYWKIVALNLTELASLGRK